MRFLRVILTSLFCLVLVVTGQSMAFARGQAPAQDVRELCVHAGIVTVHVDADGQPTSPPQLCGDCLHHMSAILFEPSLSTAPVRFALPATHVAASPIRLVRTIYRTPARAPPTS